MTPGSSTSTTSPFLSVPQPLHVILEVIHTASPAIPHSLSQALLPKTFATEKLLVSLGGQLQINTLAGNRTRYEMTIDMEMSPSNQHQGQAGQRRLLLFDDPGSSFSLSNTNNATSTKHHTSFSKDPTLSDLAKFIERLNGVKMVLHAREKSVFARHLTSCLASWNADISHVPVGVLTVRESDDDGEKKKQEQPVVPSPAIAEEQLHSVPPTFILIDDDIETLENKLKEFHHQQRRPSAQQQQHYKASRQHKGAKYTAAIIHFTSLTNYKRLRDMVHGMAVPFTGTPRLVVVPKPAGPRRFLTALHTGWHDATVEPHFMPIATSPSSPSLWMMGDQGTTNHHHPMTAVNTPAPMTGRKDGYMTPHIQEQGNHRRGKSPSSSPGSSAITAATDQNSGYFNVLRGQSSRPISPAPTTTHSSSGNRQHKSSPLGVENEEGEQGDNERGDQTMPFSSSSSPSSQLAASYQSTVQNNNNNSNNRASSPHNTDQKGLPTSTLPPETPAETPAHDEKENKDNADTTTTTPTDAANAKMSPSQENNPHHEEMNRQSAVSGHEKPSLMNSLRRKRTVRLSKKLKSDRGSSSGAFANTVSPPINVLIVEGKDILLLKGLTILTYHCLDNMINQAILSTWMKKHKIKCSVASNGQEAVERWKGGGFHLVLVSTFILHGALHEEKDKKEKERIV